MAEESIDLKVQEALTDDVGRGIVRIDRETAEKLGVTTGDILEIKGSKVTAAKVWQTHPEDEGKELIRMDGFIRENSGSALEEKVQVKKADVKIAKKITIAPVDKPLSYREGFTEFVKHRVLMGQVVSPGDRFPIVTLGTPIYFQVISSKPKGIIQITDDTQIDAKDAPTAIQASTPYVRYEDIGGLRDEISRVREMIELPMKHPELFEKLGIKPPKGVLLYGPPGTGKTLLAKAVASESNAYFLNIAGPEIMDKYYGESERKLRDVFEEAQKNAPSIIFIDEIDSIAPKRDDTKGEVERRVVAQLLALMDGLIARGNVVVVAATNRPDSLDPALRRPGRFDREIEIGVPDRDGRKEVLQIHTRGMPLAKEIKLDKIADNTHGFVGADLEAISREAAMHSLKRILPKLDLNNEEIPPEVLEEMEISLEDFQEALKMVEPSALREVMVEVPDIKWKDIGGLSEVKRELQEAVEWPLKHKDSFERMGIKAPKAVMMYGPPGCGKTLLAKAAANESDANFISIKGPELLSKWVGESEKGIREIFKKARQTAPTIIFFDEIDSIAPTRGGHSGSHVTETVVNQILTEMDGIESLENVMIIGATNRPDMIDRSLLRPGRFDRLVVVPRPDKDARLEIFKIHTHGMPLEKEVDLVELADKTKGYTGADIEAICREAALVALRNNMDSKIVTKENIENALSEIKPSVTDMEAMQTEKDLKKNKKDDGPRGYT